MTAKGWRRARQTVQILSFSLFTLMVLWTATRPATVWTATGLVRLDPLSGIAAMLVSRRFIAAFVPGLVLLALALVAGRFWCWLCPLGSLISGPRRARGHCGPPPVAWRQVQPAAVDSLCGAPGLVVSPPAGCSSPSLCTPRRRCADAVAGGAACRQGSIAPRCLPGCRRPGWPVASAVLGYKQPFWQGLWPTVLLFAGLLGLNRIAPLLVPVPVPLGALLGLASKVSWLKRRVDTSCVSCGACQQLPDGCDRWLAKYASDAGECINVWTVWATAHR